MMEVKVLIIMIVAMAVGLIGIDLIVNGMR